MTVSIFLVLGEKALPATPPVDGPTVPQRSLASAPAEEKWAGRVIGGKYVVEGIIGRGGMGLVLRARHLRLDELVAIKVLHKSLSNDPTMATRLLREARAALRLQSDHAVRVMDIDLLEDGVPYLVLEHLEGTDLASFLRAREAPMSAEQAAAIGDHACRALAEAHSLGIVHRDVKPANLWLRLPLQGGVGFEGDAHRDPGVATPLSTVVIDFGMVRSVRVPQDAAGRFVAGTAGYIAPEQVLDPIELDPRCDVYALAGTIYNVTTGRAFFDDIENPRDRIIAHMKRDPFEDPKRLETYPAAVAKLLRAATAMDFRDRPSPLELGREFAAAL